MYLSKNEREEKAKSPLSLSTLPKTKKLPGGTSGKESACQCRTRKRPGFNHWVRKIPWRREWLPTPVFLPGGLHGQRSLAGYSPWGHEESDTPEHMYLNRKKVKF